MILNTAIGSILGLIIFLAWQGYDLGPLLVIVFLAAGGYYVANTRGLLNTLTLSKGKVPKTEVNFTDIGGQDVAVKELKEALDFILKETDFAKLGIRPLKGILLTGPPGTGKTLLAKAASNYCNSVFLSASGSEFVEMYAGVGAQRIRKLFQNARSQARNGNKNHAIIFIDEIDVIGGNRGRNNSHVEYDQTLNQLLVEMDGLKADDPVKVLVIAATNRVDILDPALLRPGRFDRQVKVSLPDKEGRLMILKIHTSKKPVDSQVDLDVLAKETFGFSGALLESLTNEAAIYAMREGHNEIRMHHFRSAIEKVMMGEKNNKFPSKEETYRVAIHECGHAFVGEQLKANSVSSICITPRGEAMGYVRQSPEDDIHLYTEKVLVDQICIFLAGSEAEKEVLGNRSTGSANDYQQAVNIAQRMVMAGMSGLGLVNESTVNSEMLYKATQEILSQAESTVSQLISANKELLMKAADLLIEKEIMTGEEFRKLIKVA